VTDPHRSLFDNGSERVKVPLLCLVGASNELPESEELDALYDRFLLRKNVAQVSAAGLAEMLTGSARLVDQSMMEDDIELEKRLVFVLWHGYT
jgi:MoxR-like ATPase